MQTRLHATTLSTLCAMAATFGSASAQQLQASYPLLTDLDDATQINGPITLLGNQPPGLPNNGVCVNGVYLLAGGQDVRTPNISTLDSNDFELQVDFQAASFTSFNSPILVGGNGWRWIGFAAQSSGTLGVLYNNANYTWSSTVLTPGTWYTALLKFENGSFELYLDGALVHQGTLGVLNTGNNLNFTTNNFSNGTAFNGCIRNLLIANDTTFGPPGGPLGVNYCTPGVPNSSGASGVMGATGSRTVAANDLTLSASALPNNAFAFFLASRTTGSVTGPGGSTGNLCLGGQIGRYVGPGQIRNTGTTGAVSLVVDLTRTPQPAGLVAIGAGETWHFQCWHRDVAGGAATSNFTDGYSIVFQ